MAKIVNLGRARKARDRDAKRRAADANAAKHGQSKAEKARARGEADAALRHLDGHRREANDPNRRRYRGRRGLRPVVTGRPVKRSLTLRGHRTSVSLEEPFWQALRAIAAREGKPINALAAEIDAARAPDVGLASAIRVYVLATVQRG